MDNDGIDWQKDDFADILQKDDRYDPRAYALMCAVVEEYASEGDMPGRVLLDHFREFTLDEFGPMAFTVLADWGVNNCVDLGEIVFNLVETGRLGRSERDSRADFIGGYDFHAAFLDPFVA